MQGATLLAMGASAPLRLESSRRLVEELAYLSCGVLPLRTGLRQTR